MALAAGKPAPSYERPKPEVPVGRGPITKHVFEPHAGSGVEDVHANVVLMAATILEYAREQRRGS